MPDKKRLPEVVLYLVLFAFVLLLPITKIADFDLFFHLRLGEHLIEKLSIYEKDEFSYTYNGTQPRGEWLGNSILYLAYKIGGFYGLGILKSALFVLLIIIILKTIDEVSPDANPLIKALAIVVFSYALRFRLDLRPYYFSYLGVAFFSYEFLKSRNLPQTKRLWVLVPIEALWANLHSGFIVGPAIAGFFLLTESIRRKSLLKPALLFISIIIAGALSPEGLAPYKGLFGFLQPGTGAEEIGEWQRLTPALLWGFGLRYTWGFQVIFAGALIYLIIEAIRKRYDPYYIGLLLGSAFFSIKHVRLIDISSILLIPLFSLFLKEALSPYIKGSKKTIAEVALSVFVLLLIPISVFGSRYYSFGFGPKEGIFPDRALEFLDKNNITGNGFNTVTIGSYMIWKSPHRKVFIDGRLHQPPEFQKQYEEAIKSPEGFDALDKRWDFSFALVDYNPKAAWRFPMHLNSSSKWKLVYWDEASALYLKDNEKNSPLIERFGYRILMPSFNNFSYLDPALEHVKEAVLTEALHDLGLNPKNQEAHLAIAYISYYLGKKNITERALRDALSIPPDTAFEHLSMAQFLIEKGQIEEAKRELKIALRIDPYEQRARELLKKLR